MLVVGDTSVGNMDGGPVDVGGGFVVQPSPRRWLRAPPSGGSTASVRGGTLLARSGARKRIAAYADRG